MMMKPDFDRAAVKAAETLVKYNVCSFPVDPLPLLKAIKGVSVYSFSEMSESIGVKRSDLLATFRNSQDATCSVDYEDGKKRYMVVYNEKLSRCLQKRALARELGHIILGHDGTLPFEVREAEAKCFAHHLLSPRALIHTIKATGIRFTLEVFNNLTECNERCLECMRAIPETHVPAELNRQIRNNFMDYIVNFFDCQHMFSASDSTAIAYLGSYMDGYEE